VPEQSNLKTNRSSPRTIDVCGVRAFAGGKAVVFSVEIAKPTTRRVFMEIACTDDDDNRAVVFVETERFIAAWGREPYGFNREAALGTLDRSRLDKYKTIEDDFARSHQSPVPLAHVICRKEENKRAELAKTPTCGRTYVSPRAPPYYVDFNEGVTRTFWLIANGARAFPVAIDSTEASALHSEAGLSESPPLTIKQLLEATQSVSFNPRQHG
jgi:hypothetical protein